VEHRSPSIARDHEEREAPLLHHIKDDTAHVSGDVRAAHGVEVGEEPLSAKIT